MAARIAVVDPLPMFRQGTAAVLSAAGHTVETPRDVRTWLRRASTSLVLLSVLTEDDWDLLALVADPTRSHLVIAVLEDESGVPGVKAVRAGARSVLPRNFDAETLKLTVEVTASGRSVLPAEATAALATGPTPDSALFPTADQLSWLRHLVAGDTVAQLADRVGYSERAMFRMLQSLYSQLGVRNRIEAILHAQASGWL
ncbi:DNA-binding response regulator [Lentzea sp. NPDC060358]|uniref:DNA-binding response regulator n=1 Tax=Lentzea sp. NPDC060358 TaxID=3347103 RepID=UPI0036621B90